MNRFALVIHHKGHWLFENGHLAGGVFSEPCDNGENLNTFIQDHLGAKKFDTASVCDANGIALFLVDISAFAEERPPFLLPYTRNALPPLSPNETDLFALAMSFIADCRRVTEGLLGQEVDIIMDRPVGTRHPKHPDIVYPINYGYIDGMLSADGEGIDVYLLGIHEPLATCRAKIIAIIRREDDIEDKLAAAPLGMDFSETEIAEAVHFQEQFYNSSVHKSLS